MEIFKEAVRKAEKEQEFAAEIMQDPTITGIDLAKDAYIFAEGSSSKSEGGLVVNLADAAAFESLVQKAELGTIAKEGDINIVKSGQGELVAWNSEVAFIGAGYRNAANSEIVEALFSGDKNKSVVNHPSYKKLMTSDHDVNTWVNFNPFLKEMPPMAKMQATMFGIDEDALTDNFMYGYWDFNNGEMEGRMKYDVKDGLTKDFSAFFKKKVSTDFANKIPADYLGAAGAIGLDLKGINQVLKEKGMQDLADAQVKSMDFSLDELADGLGGDFAFAIYPNTGEDETEIILAMNVLDDKLVQKMVDFGLKTGALVSAGEGLYKLPKTGKKMRESLNTGRRGAGESADDDGWILVKDDLMYLTSSTALAKKLQSGNFKKAAKIQDLPAALGSSVVGGFFNFEAMQSMVKEFDSSKFESLTFAGSREDTHMSIKTADKSVNSLKTFFLMMEEQYKKENINL